MKAEKSEALPLLVKLTHHVPLTPSRSFLRNTGGNLAVRN
jgi:hypothetical protein